MKRSQKTDISQAIEMAQAACKFSHCCAPIVAEPISGILAGNEVLDVAKVTANIGDNSNSVEQPPIKPVCTSLS
jgi:(p)ppGpp synthase/HD superfamily hydrolase